MQGVPGTAENTGATGNTGPTGSTGSTGPTGPNSIPTSVSTVTFSTNPLSINFNSLSVGAFYVNTSATITSYVFSNGVTAGQYMIYIKNNSSGNISLSVPSGAGQSVNNGFTAAIILATTKYAIMTVTFYSSTYFINCNSYS